MKIKSNCKYSLIAPTSIGVRITPEGGNPVHLSNKYVMQCTSAETNVLCVSACLGLNTLALTKFVENSPIAEFLKRDLRARNIGYTDVNVAQGGPWGYRHQFNIADSGYGSRGPLVWNDRAGEVGRTLSVDDFDLDLLFDKEGVQMVHMSGLIAALSSSTAEFCVQLARRAKRSGVLISFDLNYRATFWAGREDELRRAFSEIASLSDVLIGNEEDYQLCLGVQGPNVGGKDLKSKLDSFKEMIECASKVYKDTKVFATTLRQVVSANHHLWGAIVYDRTVWHSIEPRDIYVLDRIGGGDGFVGGLLYGILKGWDLSKCTQFGWASGALATTTIYDYAQPTDEKQIWSIFEGDARVKR